MCLVEDCVKLKLLVKGMRGPMESRAYSDVLSLVNMVVCSRGSLCESEQDIFMMEMQFLFHHRKQTVLVSFLYLLLY